MRWHKVPLEFDNAKDVIKLGLETIPTNKLFYRYRIKGSGFNRKVFEYDWEHLPIKLRIGYFTDRVEISEHEIENRDNTDPHYGVDPDYSKKGVTLLMARHSGYALGEVDDVLQDIDAWETLDFKDIIQKINSGHVSKAYLDHPHILPVAC